MFNLPAPSSQPSVPSFNFGPTAQTSLSLPTQPSLSLPQTSFGSTNQPTFGLTGSSGLGVSAQPTFGATTQSTFGSTAQPTFNTGTQSAFGNLTSFGSQPATSFSFPNPSNTTFSFNTTNTNPLGLTQSIQPLQPSLSTSSAPTTDTSRGLGGEGTSVGQTNANNKSVKDQHLPPEINGLVESFKNFIKEQKMIRDENSQPRFSVKPIVEINSELDDVLRIQLERLQVVLQRNKKTAESLKQETSCLVSDAETAHRALKSEGISSMSYPLGPDKYVSASTTLEYFGKMVDQFEEMMKTYSRQIKELEIHLDYLHKPTHTHDLLIVVKKQHEALIALAAEIYSLHETVSREVTDYNEQASPMITGKTINIGNDPFNLSERPICQPIAFPTFSFQRTNQPNTSNVSSPFKMIE